MTDTLRTAIEAAAAELRSIPDPVERYRAAQQAREVLADGDAAIRAVQQEVALELRASGPDGRPRPWDQVGQMLGGVSRQRAQQISEGK